MVSAGFSAPRTCSTVVQQLRQAFEGEEFALERHEDRVSGGERVDGDEVERRRAIDQDIGDRLRIGGVRQRKRPKRVAQLIGAVVVLGDFKFDAEQVDGRGRDGKPRHRGRDDNVAQRRFADQHLVGRNVRACRSMPSPVEALPCGSRSMISTCSPIAASAVPRLMAVVVLPTPPFWLAMARTRGRAPAPPSRTRAGVSVGGVSIREVAVMELEPQLRRMRRIAALRSTTLSSGSIA